MQQVSEILSGQQRKAGSCSNINLLVSDRNRYIAMVLMDIEKRMIGFVVKANWYIFIIATILGFINTPFKFALGILCGGFLVTINFYLLRYTLYKAFAPAKFVLNNECMEYNNGRSILNGVIIKYYIRFAISGIVIFTLINKNIVEPMGLVIGLSVVVASIMAATALELTRLIFKEAF